MRIGTSVPKRGQSALKLQPPNVAPTQRSSRAMVVGIRRLPRSASDEQEIAGVELAQCRVANLDCIVGIESDDDARANLGHVRLECAEIGKHRFVELKDVLHTVGVLEVGNGVLAEAS